MKSTVITTSLTLPKLHSFEHRLQTGATAHAFRMLRRQGTLGAPAPLGLGDY